jgi:hypothetical protein
VEQGPQQIGKIISGLFKDAAKVVFDEFRVVRQQEQGRSEAGNPVTLNRYTFRLINPGTPGPTSASGEGLQNQHSRDADLHILPGDLRTTLTLDM